MTGARQDTWSVSLSVDGDDYGVWDKKSGGEADSDEAKYKPGGMAPEVSLGGSKTVGNVTVSRLFDLERDRGRLDRLIAATGRGNCVVKQQPLDHDGNIFGAPIVYKGVLKTCTPPEVDSESNDPAMVELEISTSGTVG